MPYDFNKQPILQKVKYLSLKNYCAILPDAQEYLKIHILSMMELHAINKDEVEVYRYTHLAKSGYTQGVVVKYRHVTKTYILSPTGYWYEYEGEGIYPYGRVRLDDTLLVQYMETLTAPFDEYVYVTDLSHII